MTSSGYGLSEQALSILNILAFLIYSLNVPVIPFFHQPSPQPPSQLELEDENDVSRRKTPRHDMTHADVTEDEDLNN